MPNLAARKVGVDRELATVLCAWNLASEQEEIRSCNDAVLACRGDKNAFARIVKKHERAVYGLCARLLGAGDEARDVAQEAFVRAWEHRSSFRKDAEFGPWILRIARNAAIDRLRKRHHMVGDEVLDTLPAGQLPADQALASARSEAALLAAVAALPARFREVIELAHVQGRSIEQIGQIVGAPQGTVMTWLYRARRLLRERLADAS